MKIALCLVHNHDQNRLIHIRPSIQDLGNALAKGHEIQLIEAAWQPSRHAMSISKALKRTAIFCATEYGLRRKHQDPIGVRQVYRSFVYRFTTDLFEILGGGKSGIRAARMIEASITDKILRNLASALEWGADLAISFEDDAVFESGSIEKIAALVDRIADLPAGELFYGDIAGGLNQQALSNPSLITRTEDDLTFYKDFQINTTCTFAINAPLMKEFQRIVLCNPNYRLLPIDWLFDRLILELIKEEKRGTCCHFSPPAVKHGSFTGDYGAWER